MLEKVVEELVTKLRRGLFVIGA